MNHSERGDRSSASGSWFFPPSFLLCCFHGLSCYAAALHVPGWLTHMLLGESPFSTSHDPTGVLGLQMPVRTPSFWLRPQGLIRVLMNKHLPILFSQDKEEPLFFMPLLLDSWAYRHVSPPCPDKNILVPLE